MTTFTTEDRLNASPPHIVDSGASVIPKLLTSSEIMDLGDKHLISAFIPAEAYAFARAIEKQVRDSFNVSK